MDTSEQIREQQDILLRHDDRVRGLLAGAAIVGVFFFPLVWAAAALGVLRAGNARRDGAGLHLLRRRATTEAAARILKFSALLLAAAGAVAAILAGHPAWLGGGVVWALVSGALARIARAKLQAPCRWLVASRGREEAGTVWLMNRSASPAGARTPVDGELAGHREGVHESCVTGRQGGYWGAALRGLGVPAVLACAVHASIAHGLTATGPVGAVGVAGVLLLILGCQAFNLWLLRGVLLLLPTHEGRVGTAALLEGLGVAQLGALAMAWVVGLTIGQGPAVAAVFLAALVAGLWRHLVRASGLGHAMAGVAIALFVVNASLAGLFGTLGLHLVGIYTREIPWWLVLPALHPVLS